MGMIVGMNIRKIDAYKNEGIAKGVTVTNHPEVKGLKEANLPSIGKPAVSIDFTFSTVYKAKDGKDVAKILLEGDILYVGDDVPEILKDWKDGRKTTADFTVIVLNAILRRSVSRAIGLAEDLQLPPPIDFPKVSKGKPTPVEAPQEAKKATSA